MELKPNAKNPKKRDDAGFERLKKSLEKFGRVFDGIANADYSVIDGHSRLELSNPDDELLFFFPSRKLSKKEYVEMNAMFDEAKAGSTDMQIVEQVFTEAQMDEWGLDKTIPDAVEDDYEVPEGGMETDIVLGDLFEIGEHRLLCGDSTNSDQVAKLMNGQKADISFTSPPYNAGKNSTLSPHQANGRKYENYDDDKTDKEYLDLLLAFTSNAFVNSIYTFVNVQSIAGNKTTLIEYLHQLKDVYADTLIWQKQNAQPAMAMNVLNSQFEYIHCFSEKANRAIGVKQFRGTLSNVIQIQKQTNNEVKTHNATFPVAFAAYFIENFSIQSVLDLFLGSGTTMVASHQLNRKCYGIELDPKYCQVIIDRMRKLDPSLIIKKNGIAI